MTALDLRAVLVGAATAAVVTLPIGALGQVVVDGGDRPGLVFAFLVPLLAGFAAGGYVAARRAPDGPLANSTVAAVMAFAVIQGVGAVRHVVAGEPLSLPSVVFAAFLACSSGLLGGLLAQQRQR
ncbi:MAG: hypothetical protein ACR2K0_05150, partial [Acidimicrobiales bacterium]